MSTAPLGHGSNTLFSCTTILASIIVRCLSSGCRRSIVIGALDARIGALPIRREEMRPSGNMAKFW